MFSLSKRQASFLQVILIIGLGLLIYSHCLNGSFVWDDHGLIKDNEVIKSWSNLRQIMKSDFGLGSGASSHYYRPLQAVIHLAGYSWWGVRPLGYHLISVFAHILAAIIFYFLLKRLFPDKILAGLASLLFLSSPVNTEAVCYISGLSDPLSLIFILACLWFYLESLHPQKPVPYILALLSFILALLSKETAVVLPLLILLYHYAFGRSIHIKKLWPFFGILMAYCLFRLFIVKGPAWPALTPVDLGRRIPVFFAGITEYLRLLVLPVGLHVEYPYKLFSFTDPRAVLGLILAVLLLTFAWRRRHVHPAFFFATFWFFIAILPVSNIYPISRSYIMEHYLYLPALGFFICLAGLFCYPAKSKPLKIFLSLSAGVLLIVYSVLTFKQAEYWKEPVAFYKRTLQQAPYSWRFHNELGIEYAEAGDFLQAQAAYQEALRLNPDALGVYVNLAHLYRKTQDQENLLAMENAFRETKSRLARQHHQAAIQFQFEGRYEQALAEFQSALELDQNNLITGSDLAGHLVLMGRYAEAVNLFNKILELKPDFALAYNNLAVAHYYLKQDDLAVKNCDRAIALGYAVEPMFIELLKTRRKGACTD